MLSTLDAIELSDISPDEMLLRSIPPSTSEKIITTRSSDNKIIQINEGALVVFDNSLSSENKADISNSFLFAQLAADKEFNRHSAAPDWVNKFTEIQGVVGWMIGAAQNTNTVVSSPVDWGEIVLPFLPKQIRPLTESGMIVCQALPVSSKAITVWQGTALEKNDGVLIVITGWSAGGSLNTSVVSINFTLQRKCTGFMQWEESFSLSIQSVWLTLNEETYAEVREMIIDRLGDRPNYLVVDVHG